ncbi:LacI family DNA-binding transcriptional regulator [Rathayibacter sp. VKM Ac-2835]|uniref:LacI family DNA-binding transcriptional regulator n=1 Tax=Rathayibacter sp. VKM Ac-2835 TaxID=2739043 RepID=UPI0015632A66|nr:LacI family DNA-binding transcriptional regulator [Rathayibacter sp. VKM Ac-2835]NRG43036.1 LacI family DNA-binding transcriptional regulator [Rathayibacter sp. VKM Ac-2835]
MSKRAEDTIGDSEPRGRKPGIAAVAARAGVSKPTVSRVMNGNASVDPILAERVRVAAAELGYSANPVARSLALGRTNTIAFVLPDLENPTFQAALRGLSRAAAQDGYRVLIADTQENVAEEHVLALETRSRCDALVLCAPRMPDDELKMLLTQVEPVVMINRNVENVSTPVVSADYDRGIEALLRHVHSLGHRDILFLQGVEASNSNRQRLRGIERMLKALPDLRVETLRCGVTFEDGHAMTGTVRGAGATAVLAFNDLVAMGLLSGLHEAGVAVPDAISVLGFDDIPFARYTTPPLTTAAVPVAELGEQAWVRLRALLRGEPVPASSTVLPRLVVRGSSGPASRTEISAA